MQQIKAGCDHAVCDQHKTCHLCGDLAKWLAPGTTEAMKVYARLPRRSNVMTFLHPASTGPNVNVHKALKRFGMKFLQREYVPLTSTTSCKIQRSSSGSRGTHRDRTVARRDSCYVRRPEKDREQRLIRHPRSHSCHTMHRPPHPPLHGRWWPHSSPTTGLLVHQPQSLHISPSTTPRNHLSPSNLHRRRHRDGQFPHRRVADHPINSVHMTCYR